MEKSTLKQTEPTRGEAVPEHGILWADGPVLGDAGAGYGGRVIVEVWEDGRATSVTKGSALLPAALAALQTGAPRREARVALPHTPITGPHNGTSFIGRVIVEFGPDGPVVGVFGSDSRLLPAAVHHLTSLVRRPGG